MKLIPKDAVLAEIERRIGRCAKQREDMLSVQCHTLAADASARMGELRCFQDFLDTLEVKEVDLEKEIDLVEDKYRGFESLSRADIIAVAKHFFELGMSVSNKAQKGE